MAGLKVAAGFSSGVTVRGMRSGSLGVLDWAWKPGLTVITTAMTASLPGARGSGVEGGGDGGLFRLGLGDGGEDQRKAKRSDLGVYCVGFMVGSVYFCVGPPEAHCRRGGRHSYHC